MSYRVIIHWQDGRQEVDMQTPDPTAAKEQAMHGIAHNPAAIRRIEIHDHESCIETVWDAGWPA